MKNSSKKPFKEQKGITLIMALLILAGISATSLTLSIIIVNELMASKNTDEAITAYYAAESGMEKGLYHFKTHQGNPRTDFPAAGETLANGAKIVSPSISPQSLVMTNLTKNQTIQLNFYNPDNLVDDAAKVNIINISGTALGTADPNDPDPEGKLEASYISWPNPGGGQLTWSKTSGDPDPMYPTTTEIYTQSNLATPGKSKNFSDGPLVYHIIRLKALYNNIEDLKIEAFYNGSPVPIPTGFVIASSGEYGRAKQKVTANVPWQKTVTGLFNYVLFTKEELEKK